MSQTAPPSQSPEVQLLDECKSSFEKASRTTSPFERYYSIADLSCTLAIAGNTIAPMILPALNRPANTATTPPDLKIHIWDGSPESGTLPHLPWNSELMTRRGDIQGFGTPTILATLDRVPGILSVADTGRGIGYYVVRNPGQFPVYEMAAPFRPILFWLLRSRDRFLVHAGAVGDGNGAVLLAGKGGSGKSTTALACLDSDLVYLADDYCIISCNAQARVWNLYKTAKATPKTLELLPFIRTFLTGDNPTVGDKTVLYPGNIVPQKIARTRPLKAILLPRVTSASEPRLTPAPRDAATSALAISTMVQLPDAGNETLAAIQSLTARLPCYYLELGSNVRAVPQVIQELLATLPGHEH